MFSSQVRPVFALRIAATVLGASALLAAGAGAGVAAEEGDAAGAPPPSMSLLVTGTSAGSTASCDSNTVTKCTLDPGSAFTVESVPDTIPAGGYVAWDMHLEYGDLAYKARATPADEITWDGSALPVRFQGGTFVLHGDLSSLQPPFPFSNQTTTLVTLDFNCNTGDSLRIVDRNETPTGTAFALGPGQVVVPEVGFMEINCGEPPVGGIALDPELGALALETQPHDSNSGLLAGIAVALVTGVAALGSVVWFVRRAVTHHRP